MADGRALQAAGSLGRAEDAVDEVWKLIDRYNLTLKQKRLMSQRKNIVKDNIPLDANFIRMSDALVEDLMEENKDQPFYQLWQKLRMVQLKVKFETTLVDSAAVTFKVDEAQDSERVAAFLKSVKKMQNDKLGTFGHGINPGEAFKNAINSLHAEYFGKQNSIPKK